MSIAVTTRSFSNYREGMNTAETVQTAIKVQKQGISHLFDCMLPGDLRGTEGMALVVPGLTMGDGLQHDVLFVCSMSNDVRAFDANTPNPETGQGQILWERRVDNPIKGTVAMDMFLINDWWGILSTPVIDTTTNTLYCVSMGSPDGLIGDSNFLLHALNLTDGSDRMTPLALNAATYFVTLPDGSLKMSMMGSVPRKQRCGLALMTLNNMTFVVIANGSFNEDASTNQGWVIVCEVTGPEMSIFACWTSTSLGSGGGIWQGSQGLTIDDNGFIYGMVGNGDFQPPYDFGESFYKLQLDTTAKTLTLVDWFTPFTDSGRVGADPTLPSAPNDDDAPGGTSNMDSPGDEDLNSGGPLFLPTSLTGLAHNLILGAGKDGILYVVDADNMGKPVNAQFAPDQMSEVYAMLLSPPIGFTYDPRPMNTAPLITSELLTTNFGYTHHQHSTPVYYNSPRFGRMLFTQGENGPLRAWRLNDDYTLTYLACGTVIASQEVPPPGGMPGGMLTGSCNGTVEDTCVIWVCTPYGNANNSISPGRLCAYGGDWIDDGTILKIWDSQDWGIPITHDKFDVPACINGKIYVPSYDGRVLVMG